MTKMDVIKADSHQREIWYFYRFSELSGRWAWKTEFDDFAIKRNIEFSCSKIPFLVRELACKENCDTENMFKYLKTKDTKDFFLDTAPVFLSRFSEYHVLVYRI